MTRPKSAPVSEAQDSTLSQITGWGQRGGLLRGGVLLVITVVIFLVLFQRIDLGIVVSLLSEIPATTWLWATILTLSFPVISAIRWHLVLSSMDYDVSVPRCLLIIMGVWPVSAVSPSKAGDLLKAYSLRREFSGIAVAGSILAERALDLLILAGFALIGGLAFRDLTISLAAGGVVLGVLLAVALTRLPIPLPLGPKLRAMLDDLLRSFRVLGRDRKLFAFIMLLTVVNWGGTILQINLLFDGVGADASLAFTAAAAPVAIFVGLLPISIGGMGTRDAAMVVLFGTYASPSQGLAVGLLYSFFGYWLLAVIGLPFIRRGLSQ